MTAAERLMRYCRIDTQSDPESDTVPSTMKQFDLARLLVRELKELGVEDADVDEHCYVYGHLPANCQGNIPRVGFIAHMDTSPDYSGENVSPRIIENYDGEDIELSEGVVTKVSDFPAMRLLKGKRIMVSDSSTLLGADDKAGITAVMEAVAYYHLHPEIRHGTICVAFTPDEEIGRGTVCFDLERFGADFAYTMDGGALKYYCDETFNAASAVVRFHGFTIHPGEAKNRMINAMNTAHVFHGLLPEHMRPEHTEGREGFIHLTGMRGDCDFAELNYIIRDHDAGKLQEKLCLMKRAVDFLNQTSPGCAEIEVKESYRNMKEIISEHPEVSEIALRAIESLGITPELEAVRGGTDGAELSYRGLPCPNLGTGGGNFHGRYEYCDLEELELASELIRRIVESLAEEELA